MSRFGLVVSDKVATGAVPILGAVGGATVNVLFMDHFQRVGLERTYGAIDIRQRYAELVARIPAAETSGSKTSDSKTSSGISGSKISASKNPVFKNPG